MLNQETKFTAEITFRSPLIAKNKFRRSPEGKIILTANQWRGFIKANGNRIFLKNFKTTHMKEDRVFLFFDHYVSIEELHMPIIEPTEDIDKIDVYNDYILRHKSIEKIQPGCKCLVTFICHGENAANAVKAVLNRGVVEGFGYLSEFGYGKFTWKEVTTDE